jgi:hypothetical protein
MASEDEEAKRGIIADTGLNLSLLRGKIFENNLYDDFDIGNQNPTLS